SLTKNIPLRKRLNWPVFMISGGILLLFVFTSVFFTEGVSKFVDKSFNLSITYFGAYWQVLLLATFIVGLFLAFSKYGNVRLGNIDKPEMSFFKWVSIIVTSGLVAGGIFWAAAEPVYYFRFIPQIHSGTDAANNVPIAISHAS